MFSLTDVDIVLMLDDNVFLCCCILTDVDFVLMFGNNVYFL